METKDPELRGNDIPSQGTEDQGMPAKAAAEKKTTIGGQALIEGLMMYGPQRIAMAVRKADGSIYLEEIVQGKKKMALEKVPFVRGLIRFYRQIVTGTGAMMKSAEISDFVEDKPDAGTEEAGAEKAGTEATGTDIPDSDKPKEKKSRLDIYLESHMNVMIMISAILGIVFFVALFILLPRLIVDGVLGLVASERSESTGMNVLFNLIEGVLRITFLFVYIALTSRIKDIARVWMYHGAEHKTISCYEAGEPLTVENIRKYSTRHARCGTAFLFIVVVISVLVFSIAGAIAGAIIGANYWWLNILLRLALIPLVAGIAYEILRLSGKYEKTLIGRIISKPGLWLQRFTTKEPDDSMLEVAIAAMQAVIPENEGEDVW
jgi:uncharacterized protein YqhQ